MTVNIHVMNVSICVNHPGFTTETNQSSTDGCTGSRGLTPVNSNFMRELSAFHLHSWHSLSASCCGPGATLLFFMNLLLREAEDRVPDVKHSFFIKSSDDMRLVLQLVNYLRRWPHRTRCSSRSALKRCPISGRSKSEVMSSELPGTAFKIKRIIVWYLFHCTSEDCGSH